MCRYGLRWYGPHGYGLQSHGLYSCGLHRYGLYSYGLRSYGLTSEEPSAGPSAGCLLVSLAHAALASTLPARHALVAAADAAQAWILALLFLVKVPLVWLWPLYNHGLCADMAFVAPARTGRGLCRHGPHDDGLYGCGLYSYGLWHI